MNQLNDAQIWEGILARAKLGDEAISFRYAHPEFKRQTLFLRISRDLGIDKYTIDKVRLSALESGYHLRVTGKWATVEDLKIAVGDIQWLWKTWIPLDMITLLAADPGVGKSTLAMWFCKIVAEGGLWPDGYTQEPGNSVYIDAENAQVITASHAVNLGVPMDKVFITAFDNDMLSGVDLNQQKHKETLWQMAQDLKPKLWVVDSLGSSKSGAMNQKEDIEPTMMFLSALARESHSGMVVIHHLNKTQREESAEIALNRVAGSYAVGKHSRSVIFLEDKPSLGIKMWIGKNNVSKKPSPMRVTMEESERELADGEKEIYVSSFSFEHWSEEQKLTKIEESQQWVINHLAEKTDYLNVARNIFEIGDETYTRRTLKEAGAILERKGIISRSGGRDSVWKLLQPPLRERTNGHKSNGIEVIEDWDIEI